MESDIVVYHAAIPNCATKTAIMGMDNSWKLRRDSIVYGVRKKDRNGVSLL